jgi:hypothetical protein
MHSRQYVKMSTKVFRLGGSTIGQLHEICMSIAITAWRFKSLIAKLVEIKINCKLEGEQHANKIRV